MAILKTSTGEDREVEELAMANCSKLLLSRAGPTGNLRGRVFKCKTCYKQFPSSQALGSHRARHKLVPPTIATEGKADNHLFHGPRISLPVKLNTMHECLICGLKFSAGRALGGHMRRHRANICNDGNSLHFDIVPILKRSNSSKRVLCLDLNLTPYEIHLL